MFAADEKEKRLRFKPMQPQQRAFLHSLAEDFGLDSESADPEPHRHVCIFKTPRFVSAPMKTLSQCVKIKATPVVQAAVEPTSKPLVSSGEPYNAILLSNPRFGLTIDELRADLHAEFSSSGGSAGAAFSDFDISFLPAGDVVLKPLPTHFLPGPKLEAGLVAVKPAISRKVKALSLADSTALCAVDASVNVVRREDDGTAGAGSGGWSQVAKGAGRKAVPVITADLGHKSTFTVLGNKGVKKAKQKEVEEAVDDWEQEVDGWGEGGKAEEEGAKQEGNA